MSDYQFDTPAPVRLYCELGRGSVRLTATNTDQTTIELSGPVADQVDVRHAGDEISIVAPRQHTGFFGGEAEVFVEVTLPTRSDALVRSGSADLSLVGEYAACALRSGSGDVQVETVTEPSQVETGSGDVTIDVANAELRVKSGSGDVQIRHAGSEVAVSTGSGDVRIATAHGSTAVKTGSGDLTVEDAHDDVSLATASGDMVVATAHRGRLTMRGATGDVKVGVPAGIPVWTDVSTLTGDISSTLDGAGEPAEGAAFVEVRANTVSGDIALRQL